MRGIPGVARERGLLGLLGLTVVLGAAGCSDDTAEPSSPRTAPVDGTDDATTEETSPPAGTSGADTGAATSDGAGASGGDALPTSDEPRPIEAGTYEIEPSAWSVVGYSVTIPEGWAVQYGQGFVKHPDTSQEMGFYPFVVEEVHADTCPGTNGEAVRPGPGVDDLVSALRAQAGPEVSEPAADTLGDQETTRLDLRVPEGYDLSGCNAADIGLQVWYSEPADKNLLLLPGKPARLHIFEVEGQRQVFVVEHAEDATEDDIAELQAVLDSIEIDG